MIIQFGRLPHASGIDFLPGPVESRLVGRFGFGRFHVMAGCIRKEALENRLMADSLAWPHPVEQGGKDDGQGETPRTGVEDAGSVPCSRQPLMLR